MRDFRFLPAGRILAGAGADRSVTLFNCFVMGEIPDDMSGIFRQLQEAALTMQQGGGIGYDFSTLRPRGAPVRGVGADASGPLSFMDVWDSMCRTIMSAGHRRGAMMATMRCDHPDIEAFIEAKREPGRLRMFNLSVLVTDAFMDAVRRDDPWDLVFGGTVYRTVQARALWDASCARPTRSPSRASSSSTASTGRTRSATPRRSTPPTPASPPIPGCTPETGRGRCAIWSAADSGRGSTGGMSRPVRPASSRRAASRCSRCGRGRVIACA